MRTIERGIDGYGVTLIPDSELLLTMPQQYIGAGNQGKLVWYGPAGVLAAPPFARPLFTQIAACNTSLLIKRDPYPSDQNVRIERPMVHVCLSLSLTLPLSLFVYLSLVRCLPPGCVTLMLCECLRLGGRTAEASLGSSKINVAVHPPPLEPFRDQVISHNPFQSQLSFVLAGALSERRGVLQRENATDPNRFQCL